jgi:hypothetical protein
MDGVRREEKLVEIQSTQSSSAWQVVGAAVQGVAHLRLNLPCQDAQGYRVLPNGVLLAAVADGAGTARFSDQGARAAVSEMLRALEAALSAQLPPDAAGREALLRDAISSARLAVLTLARQAGESAREYACTLAGVIVHADGLVAGQIGDGAVVVQEEDGSLVPATRLQRGEYANETHFLAQENALDQVEISSFERPVRAVAVMSDGLIRLALKMPAQTPHLPFFEPLFRFAAAEANSDGAVEQLERFLGSARVNERTDDDKALVLAVRGTVAINGDRAG